MQNASADPTRTAPRREGVQSIARAAGVLRMLGAHPDGLQLGELSSGVGLAKSTVHRLLAALAAEELVRTETDGRIVLGGAVSVLAASRADSLPRQLRPVLETLHGELGETVDLAVLDAGEVRFTDQIPAAHRLRAVSSVGARFPLHCTANGKALLAALGQERAAAILPRRLRRLTPNTITERAALMHELELIRRDGVAVDREEHTVGICAFGVAVLAGGQPVAAISLPVPSARFAAGEPRYLAPMRRAGRDAARLLSI